MAAGWCCQWCVASPFHDGHRWLVLAAAAVTQTIPAGYNFRQQINQRFFIPSFQIRHYTFAHAK
jgi:hypothetical protein